MGEKSIIDDMEQVLMDRITENLAKDEDYRQSVEKEGKAFDWLRDNLTGEVLEKLNEYFSAVCTKDYCIEKLSYLQGMKDLFAFYEYFGGRSDKKK